MTSLDIQMDCVIAERNGAAVLGEVEAFLSRFVVYPTTAARVAHTLWIAHAWLMDQWESTPRIAFLSPEPGSGKSRALEVTEPLVPRAVHAVNTTPAYLFRKVSDEAGPPTILYDEVDTVFGPRAKDNEEVRGMLNAGHRRGALAGRCVMRGKVVETEELPAYCAVALAGLDDLPDTIRTRSVIVRMRRRAPGERVEPWRQRINSAQAAPIAGRLAAWTSTVSVDTWPAMPDGVEDRNADVWEALLAVADLAGGDWPHRARAAAVELVGQAADARQTMGVQLLHDLRLVFAGADAVATETILDKLCALDESPWGDLRGKPLDARGLSSRLRKYDVKPTTVRINGTPVKGYKATDLHDAWSRYLPVGPDPEKSVTAVTAVTLSVDGFRGVTDQGVGVTATGPGVTDQGAQIHAQVTGVTAVTDSAGSGPTGSETPCRVCSQRMMIVEPGQTTHPTCEVDAHRTDERKTA